MTYPVLVNPFMFKAGSPTAVGSCCGDCGFRPPCGVNCPHVSQLMQDLQELTAFEYEPVPAFLTRPRQERMKRCRNRAT
jgi:hypothetical protein